MRAAPASARRACQRGNVPFHESLASRPWGSLHSALRHSWNAAQPINYHRRRAGIAQWGLCPFVFPLLSCQGTSLQVWGPCDRNNPDWEFLSYTKGGEPVSHNLPTSFGVTPSYASPQRRARVAHRDLIYIIYR